MGVTLHQVERGRYEQLLATVEDDPVFQKALSAGRELPVEEAVVYARADDDSSQPSPARLGCFAKRLTHY
jgi:hypothetical protein